MGSSRFSQEEGFLLIFTWSGEREEEGKTGGEGELVKKYNLVIYL